MGLRTTNPISNQQSLLDLNRLKERFATLQEQLTTGKRINRLSDDPTGAAMVIDFKNSVERNTQYGKIIDHAQAELKSTETVASSLESTLVRIMELAEQGSSDLGLAARQRIAVEVDGLRTQLINLSNTQFEGKYLFSGNQTQTQPFAGPAAGPVAYSGDSVTRTLDVSLSMTAKVNIPGDQMFFGTGGAGSTTDMFQQVTALRDALNANNTAAIQTAYTNIKAVHGHVNDMLAELGGRQATLDQLSSNLQDYNLSLKSIQNTYEALDYPEAITEYSENQVLQQAALSTLAKSGKTSLFDFIG